MIDARIFTNDLEPARKKLGELGASFKGEYIVKDSIYESKDPNQSLSDVFLRLRYVSKNIWNEKPIIVCIKTTQLKTIGKESIIPLKKEFDSIEEAKQFIKSNYADTFEYSFTFERTGWQYDIDKNQIDLEDIEGYPSIELKSSTEEDLHKLLKFFEAKNVITGPSVVAIKKILQK